MGFLESPGISGVRPTPTSVLPLYPEMTIEGRVPRLGEEGDTGTNIGAFTRPLAILSVQHWFG